MRADCTNEDLIDRWQIVVDTHYAKAAVDDYRQAHEKDLPSGASVWTYLVGPDEEVVEPEISEDFDPAKAAAEYEAQQRRHAPT